MSSKTRRQMVDSVGKGTQICRENINPEDVKSCISGTSILFFTHVHVGIRVYMFVCL